MKKILCLALAVLTAAALISGCGTQPSGTPSAQPGDLDGSDTKVLTPIDISFAVFHAESSLDVTQFVTPWLDEISARCTQAGYDVRFDVYYGETLCSNPDTYKTVLEGTVDMGMFLTPLGGLFSLEEVLFFPQNDTQVYRPSRIYQDLYYAFPEIQAEWEDVHVVGMVMETPQYMMCNKKFADLAGSKGCLWNTTGAICTSMLDKFGWASVSCGPTDVYTYAERGIIDGCGTSAKNIISNAWYEVFDYTYNCIITNMMESIIMNQGTWNGLPPEVQAVFDELGIGGGYELCDMYDETLAKIENDYMKKLVSEYGMEQVELSSQALAEFQTLIDQTADEWAAGLDAQGQPGSKILEKYYELVEQYSAEDLKWSWQ